MNLPFFWRKKTWLSYLLSPFSILFFVIITIRRLLYQYGIFTVYRPPVPVIIVGNVSVGGNGKTPLVIAISKKLQATGWQVGIVSRGYQGTAKNAQEVTPDSRAEIVGDEPLLIAHKTGLPTFVASKRSKAVQALLEKYPSINLIISDDGLQHYALARDIEIIAIAADFGLGNGLLLPAGALREPASRLQTVDFTVQTGIGTQKYGEHRTQIVTTGAYPLQGGHWRPFSAFLSQTCYALTAIARPERFFDMLEQEGIPLQQVKYLPDHSKISLADIHFSHNGILFVTEKDAVKMNWSTEKQNNIWVVDYQMVISEDMWTGLQKKLNVVKLSKHFL